MSLLDRMLDRALPRAITMEPLRSRHLPQVLEIEQRSYQRTWSEKVFRSEVAQARAGRRHYLVARRGQTVIGYGGMMYAGGEPEGEAHVSNIAVHPDHRRHGVATRLLVALARTARQRGCPAWTLEVRATSTGAHGLYRNFGFVPAGVRPGYYENGIDAIVMWCHELQSDAYARLLDELDVAARSRA